jgi:hypothetical protein
VLGARYAGGNVGEYEVVPVKMGDQAIGGRKVDAQCSQGYSVTTYAGAAGPLSRAGVS